MARRPLSSPAEAWGRDPPEENSSSGPTSEPVEFPSNEIINSWRGGNNTSAWHPKLTLYRLLVIFSTVGLGAAKAVTSYFNLTHTSITLEWILGVVVFLMLHILGTYEVSHTRRIAWLFEVDYLDYLWNFLHKFARIHRPYYRTDEDNSLHIRTSGRPLMTGYRLLLTSTVFIAGMSKSALVYGNLQTEATTVEWAFGVLVATGLYWLGLYETSSTKVYPTMFHVDHSAGAFYFSSDNGSLVLSPSHWDIVDWCVKLRLLVLRIQSVYVGLLNTTPSCIYRVYE
ncbi:hypothetical protein M413DRAFT_28527 [Hebeloma cylindrosporum]|uniref:Uncharacterized protein n=1 Tax=Hebeloma cylindrosporum TaxID=76867 RepID=A0A0C3BVX0_HEBCY|nr:hypothetical protein M413DRAFT_28527 [Hebeloma cylindrosporum h7]